MTRSAKALICVAVLGAVGIGALIGTGLGNDPAPAAASAVIDYDTVRPAMQPVDPAPATKEAATPNRSNPPRKPKKPKITDLITTDPVPVDGSGERVAVLSCGKSRGIALDGGVLSPPAPAQVVVTVLSRANPNPPFANSPKLYYVGVRNLDPAPTTFRATLVCAKGVDVK